MAKSSPNRSPWWARLRWACVLIIMLALPLMELVLIVFSGMSPCRPTIAEDTLLMTWAVALVAQTVFAICLIHQKNTPLALGLSLATHAVVIMTLVVNHPLTPASSPPPYATQHDGLLCPKGRKDSNAVKADGIDLAPATTAASPAP